MKTFTIKDNVKKFLTVLFWILIWQVVSLFTEEILFVSPFKVLPKIFENLGDLNFYQNLLSTVLKVSWGFILGLIAALFLGGLSYRFKVFQELISPLILFLKSVPVVSFIMLAWLFLSPQGIPVLISFIIVVPIVYLNFYEGLSRVDKSYLNMAEVFNVGLWKKVEYIYLPSVRGYLLSAVELSIGMAWKSGLAAEVITFPEFGLGALIYNSKLYLDTVNLFAYTIMAVVSCYILEKGVLYIIRRILK
ncbi:ABC transporter permease [Anaerosphaera multitolerans]|uniref:ABC transporter permease subunit n=1 Tax=Anaerosphaera multitolerans TaxID=2487351 RepID=A0A437S8V3_9FIRM|nr:ABC transporter permease subunit [Anaerosphaera multitolerans]RVU55535.1 ABC transporter permease subunit [Anaerosphaera multitolerans]